MEKYILYTDQNFDDQIISKTAHCIIRFEKEKVLCVFDKKFAGKCVGDVCKEFKGINIPIIDDLGKVSSDKNNLIFVIGFAPVGGEFTKSQLILIQNVLSQGIKICNGLHDKINHKKVINLRHLHKDQKLIAKGEEYSCKRILTVGTDHSIGKMTSTIKIYQYMKKMGLSVEWIATGQTGMIIKGEGCVLDALPIDFVPGHLEKMIVKNRTQYLLIEGQGSIFHPAYSPTSFALFHTSRPDYFILCHRMGQEIGETFGNRLPSLSKAINFYVELAQLLGFNSKPLGVSLNSSKFTFKEYLNEKNKIEKELGIPCYDPIKESPQNFVKDFISQIDNQLLIHGQI